MLGAMNLSLGMWKNLALRMKKQGWGDAKKIGETRKGHVPPSSFSLLFHPRLPMAEPTLQSAGKAEMWFTES